MHNPQVLCNCIRNAQLTLGGSDLANRLAFRAANGPLTSGLSLAVCAATSFSPRSRRHDRSALRLAPHSRRTHARCRELDAASRPSARGSESRQLPDEPQPASSVRRRYHADRGRRASEGVLRQGASHRRARVLVGAVNQDASCAPLCPAILSTTLRFSLPSGPRESARSPFPRALTSSNLALALSAVANKESPTHESPAISREASVNHRVAS
jgi:hypothetical protein